jgi:hypothetical protein
VRFTSPHPRDFTDDVLEAMAETPVVCPHLHLPLQSGSDRMLREMRRSYRQRRYLALVERIRELLPDPALTTDIIVGFPGETDEDFAQTLEVVEQVRFDQAFTFQYSPRPGTPRPNAPTSSSRRGGRRPLPTARGSASGPTRSRPTTGWSAGTTSCSSKAPPSRTRGAGPVAPPATTSCTCRRRRARSTSPPAIWSRSRSSRQLRTTRSARRRRPSVTPEPATPSATGARSREVAADAAAGATHAPRAERRLPLVGTGTR